MTTEEERKVQSRGLAYGGGRGVYRDEGARIQSLVTCGGSVKRCFYCGAGNPCC
ncbi:hypothetical protein ES332_D13G123000v1 [Gossypium tomentosum]|uniref:Uncharacterized protein n=1 Tax=Gossypium tomentosum TaxID=34277 RepID=A0A5D2HXG3_GOSTO|nr:hypothetical protein ES332_D13G123000v1 [Gossypium tomentosum]